ARAIERGFFQQAIAQSAYAQQRAIEAGESVVVGVNEYADDQGIPSVPAPDYSRLAKAQRKRLGELRGKREALKDALTGGGRVTRALKTLEAAARDGTAPLMEPIIDAVRARGTVGEISDVLRGVWGEYRPVEGRWERPGKGRLEAGVLARRLSPFLPCSVAPCCSFWMAYSTTRGTLS